MAKRNLREHFEEGWNKLFGKEEDKSKLRTQSLYGARQSKINLNAGTPHDWEDLKKYQEELEKIKKMFPDNFFEN